MFKFKRNLTADSRSELINNYLDRSRPRSHLIVRLILCTQFKPECPATIIGWIRRGRIRLVQFSITVYIDAPRSSRVRSVSVGNKNTAAAIPPIFAVNRAVCTVKGMFIFRKLNVNFAYIIGGSHGYRSGTEYLNSTANNRPCCGRKNFHDRFCPVRIIQYRNFSNSLISYIVFGKDIYRYIVIGRSSRIRRAVCRVSAAWS